MPTLLKDLPEFKERIEGSYSVKAAIKDELNGIEVDTSFETSTFQDEIINAIITGLKEAEFTVGTDGRVSIANKQDVAQTAFSEIESIIEDWNFGVANSDEVATAIADRITEFVNDNYKWKGVKA